MNDIIKNLADQGKNAKAEWMTNCVDILVKNFACMSSAFLARHILDTTHSFRVNKIGTLMDLRWVQQCANLGIFWQVLKMLQTEDLSVCISLKLSQEDVFKWVQSMVIKTLHM